PTPTKKSSKWRGEIAFGYKFAKGNTNENTFSFHQKLVFDDDPWKNTINLHADNTVSNGRRTEEKYYLTEKLDRKISTATYSFFRGSYEKDLFSGFDYQGTYVIGIGHLLINRKNIQLSIEMGIGGIQEKKEGADKRDDSLLLYFADEFSFKFSETAELGQQITVESSEINTITRTNVFVKSSLTEKLSLRVSYGLKHNSEVIEDKKHTDIETLASVVYTF
ncbi:MAG: DUF481 domain-containing protein, partial [Cellvibrionales bacterium]|nr:DUF481 domain-containing protein [Cellvibrionales bacterium]